jgi:ribosomal protein L23
MEVLMYPLATEKSVRLIEDNNEIVFVVHPKSNKHAIKNEFEQTFKVKVKSVRTETMKNKKRAYIRLDEKSNALDIATELGMI